MNPELAGFVGGGGNDSSWAGIADDERFSTKRGVIEDFYGRTDDLLQMKAKTGFLHKHRAKQTPPVPDG